RCQYCGAAVAPKRYEGHVTSRCPERPRRAPAPPPVGAKPNVSLINAGDRQVSVMKERPVTKPTDPPQRCAICNGATLADDRVRKDRNQQTVHKRCSWSDGFKIEPYGPGSNSSGGGRGSGKRR